MKKAVGYFLLAIFVVAILAFVYLFFKKGYSGNGITIAPILQNTTSQISPQAAKETGTVTSTKISLIVTSPKDGDTLGSTNATVIGKTAPSADVFVDDQSGKADSNGNFSISLGLDEGSNQIVVSANDSNGNAAEQDLTVNVLTFQ